MHAFSVDHVPELLRDSRLQFALYMEMCVCVFILYLQNRFSFYETARYVL